MTKSKGDLIREARLRKGMTQAELAEEVGISRGYVIKLEKDQSQASAEIVVELARVLGLRPTDLASQSFLASMEAMRGIKKLQDRFSSIRIVPGGDGRQDVDPDEYLYDAVLRRREIIKSAEDLAARMFERTISMGGRIPVTSVITDRLADFAASAGVETEVEFELYEKGPTRQQVFAENGVIKVRRREDLWEEMDSHDVESRFELAHALAHVALHGASLRESEGMRIKDFYVHPLRDVRDASVASNVHVQANCWAGAFLIPSNAFEAFLRRHREGSDVCTYEDIAQNFNVSIGVVNQRLPELLVAIAVTNTDE